jgi:YHS domain-containing protein
MKAPAFFLFLLAFLAASPLLGQQVRTNRQGVAIDGYDPVSYFSGKPQKGNPAFAHAWEGATYHFVSKANQEAFAADPARYAPLYGGWCAYGIGKSGNKYPVNPETYKIVDGRLLLFYNASRTNTLQMWNEEGEEALKRQADLNWAKP